MPTLQKMQTIEVSVQGMDCAECTQHVQHAIAKLPGVETVNVLLSSEKAVIRLDPEQVSMASIAQAVKSAGYTVPDAVQPEAGNSVEKQPAAGTNFTRQILGIFGVIFGVVLFAVVVGEWFGFFDSITRLVPWYIGTAVVLAAGYPIFRNVVKATLRKQVIAHTLMSVGVVAALVIGQWATALVIVFFMRMGQYTETLTTERARRAVKDLATLAPQTARVERDGIEVEVLIGSVLVGDIVVVRPGEKIPVDGDVISGQATVNQATITGESMPVEVAQGAAVFAATIAQLGSLRVRTTRVGADTTFGRVVRLVEEAEAHRADVQRIADKVSAYYLPVVAAIAALTFILRQDPLATAAVLVVACSCSFAIATPIAMLASVGAAAKRGLLIKGGKYIEELARIDVLLLDKTGTLTLGQPRITNVVTLNGLGESELVGLVAS
ncbi:MAG: HAD-IC family P-type ATPase, partial [Chloroflexota bacterium]